MLSRLINYARDLVLGIDRASGETLAAQVGSYTKVAEFLDDNPDLECPWCGMEGHHAPDCELASRVRQAGF